MFSSAGSNDPDGTIASYAWDFGDSSTSSSQNPNHTYAAGGTYSVTLTVTDNEGATGSVTHSVTVTAPAHPDVAVDDFERTVSGGWGSATTGGAWTRTAGAASSHSVDGHTGTMTMASLGTTVAEYLNSVSETNLSGTVDVSFSAAPAGGGAYAYLAVRHTSQGEYRVRVRVQPASVTLQATKVVSGTETTLASTTISGLVYNAGDALRMKFDVNGTGTTNLMAKVWKTGGTEPASWQLNTTDATAALQNAGSVGLIGYLSSVAGTTAPLTIKFDNLDVTRD
jgi:PKD repeat protein